MNYQVVPFWLYSAKLAALIVIGFVLTFFSITSFILYMIVIGGVWAVFISLKIHGMKEKGLILKNSDVSNWLVYINGIPVREQRKVLTNPCFAVCQNAQVFLRNAFIVKLIIQILFCGYLLMQILSIDNIYGQALGLCVGIYIALSLWQSIQAITEIQKEQLVIEELVSPSGSHWYRVYFTRKNSADLPALDRLLAL